MRLSKRVQLAASPLLHGACALSRALYNIANWYVRQDLFHLENRLFYTDLYAMLRHHPCYVALQAMAGAHVPQQVLRQVDNAWNAFFKAMIAWKQDPSGFRGCPKPPGYKRKGTGNVVSFTKQQVRVRDGHVRLPEKFMKQGMPAIPTTFADDEVIGVRIVPCGDRYTYEILHEVAEQDLGLNKDNMLGVDIGLENIATTSGGFTAKGGALKSVNQYYNKQVAKAKSIAKSVNGRDTTKRIARMTRVRNNTVHDLLHKVSRALVDDCISRNVGTVFIGHNPGWKDSISLGSRTNQNFVQVPLLRLVEMVEYKAALVGIDVLRITEEFTSQACSRCGLRRKANRVHRGLYKCKRCGLLVNADVNAARNILQKGIRERQPVVEATAKVADRGGLNPPARITAAS